MKKKLLALTLALATVFTMAPATVSADTADSSANKIAESSENVDPSRTSESGVEAPSGANSESSDESKGTSGEASEKESDEKDSGAVDSNNVDNGVTESTNEDVSGTDIVDVTEGESDVSLLSEQKVTVSTIEEGYYTIYSKLASNLVLDIYAGSDSQGANVDVYSYNGSDAQIFYVKPYTDSNGKVSYSISPLSATDKSLDVYGAIAANGTNVWQYESNTSAAQRWTFTESTAKGYYFIHSGLSTTSKDLVLDISGGSTKPGTNVQVYTNNGSNAQQWAFKKVDIKTIPDTWETIEEGYYTIYSKVASNLVLDISAGSESQGANVDVYSSNGSAAQIFYIKPYTDPDGKVSYAINPFSTLGKSIDVYGGKAKNSTNVWQYGSNSSSAQRWILTAGSQEGYYVIHSALSIGGRDLVLDISGGSSKPGANVQIYSYNGSNAQQWSFKKVEIKSFPEGCYEIHPYSNSGKSLDIAAAANNNGANVQIYSSNHTAAQKFYVKSLGYGNYYKIIGCASYKAVDIAGGSSSAGTNIQLYSYNGSDAQKWKIVDSGKVDANGNTVYNVQCKNWAYMGIKGSNVQTVSSSSLSTSGWTFTATEYDTSSLKSGIYVIASKANINKVFDITSGSVSQCAQLQLYDRNDSNAQKYKLEDAGDGYVRLVALNSGLCLNVSGGTAANNTVIWQYRNDNSAAVKFKLVDTGDGDGSVYLQYYNNKFNIDIPGGQATNGNKLKLYSANGTTAQKFYLIQSSISTGWQNYLGKYRYVYDSNGNYYKNTYVDGIKVGPDGVPLDQWVVKDGYYRYWLSDSGSYVNDVRPYLIRLFGKKTATNVHGNTYEAPNCVYKATVDRTKCLVTIYTKYPGTNDWNLPVCAFKCSPGTNATPTDAGTRHTILRTSQWCELMGPSYGQYGTLLSPSSAGELFHSVAGGAQAINWVNPAAYNMLGTKQSHGCIRLDVRNAYWISTFCQIGMEVYVGDNLAAPISNVPQPKMAANATIDPTDVSKTGNYGYTDTNVYYNAVW